MRTVLLTLALLLAVAAPADADDDPVFRRTTPRSPLVLRAASYVFGVPAGRAWGLESQLIPIRSGGLTLALDLEVDDPAIAEGFVRVAWYDRGHGRPAQLLTEDSPYVLDGVERRVRMLLVPPPEAVAFRLRVLARALPAVPSSAPDAVAVSRILIEDGLRPRPSLTRLR